MIKTVKTARTSNLKTKMINVLMRNGEKKTVEKILLKFLKFLQKSTNKRFKNLIQVAIINSTSTFKINEQIIKRGKRKSIRSIPSFITSDVLRVTNSFKLLRNVVFKTKNSNYFYKNLVNEFLASSQLKGQSVEKKVETQKQILMNKRYLSKFRW